MDVIFLSFIVGTALIIVRYGSPLHSSASLQTTHSPERVKQARTLNPERTLRPLSNILDVGTLSACVGGPSLFSANPGIKALELGTPPVTHLPKPRSFSRRRNALQGPFHGGLSLHSCSAFINPTMRIAGPCLVTVMYSSSNPALWIAWAPA
jgi:hypothetical protein